MKLEADMYSSIHPRICLDLALYDIIEINRLCEEILIDLLADDICTGKSKLHILVLMKTLPRLQRISLQAEWEGNQLSDVEDMEPAITLSFTDDLADWMADYLLKGYEDDEGFLRRFTHAIQEIPDVFEERLFQAIAAHKD